MPSESTDHATAMYSPHRPGTPRSDGAMRLVDCVDLPIEPVVDGLGGRAQKRPGENDPREE